MSSLESETVNIPRFKDIACEHFIILTARSTRRLSNVCHDCADRGPHAHYRRDRCGYYRFITIKDVYKVEKKEQKKNKINIHVRFHSPDLCRDVL